MYALYILFFSTLQVTFPQSLSFHGQIADFMMVCVILTGYLFGPTDGAVIGLIMGVLRDVLASPTLGIGMLLLMYVGLISSLLFTRIFHRKLTLGFVQVLIITLAYKIIGHTLYFLIPLIAKNDSEYLSLSSIVFDSILPQLAINLVISIPIILLLQYVGPYRKGFVRFSNDGGDSVEGIWQIR